MPKVRRMTVDLPATQSRQLTNKTASVAKKDPKVQYPRVSKHLASPCIGVLTVFWHGP